MLKNAASKLIPFPMAQARLVLVKSFGISGFPENPGSPATQTFFLKRNQKKTNPLLANGSGFSQFI